MFSPLKAFAVVLSLISLTASRPAGLRPLIGGCESTQYGCCRDNVTACSNITCFNCPPNNQRLVGGCIGTQFGCCPDQFTPCVNTTCSNCISGHLSTGSTGLNETIVNLTSKLILGGCSGTEFGCCRDNITTCADPKCRNCYSVV